MNLKRVFPALIVVLAAVAVLTGCGGSGGGAYGGGDSGAGASATPAATSSAGAGAQTPSSGVTVSIQNFAFTPSTLTVAAGTEVTWTNNDTTAHDVTSTDGPSLDAATTDLFASGTLGQGDTFSHTFADPGTYYYECTIHATMQTMHAEVIVE